MMLELYYSTVREPMELMGYKTDLVKVLSQLESLKTKGVSVHIIDTATWSEAERLKIYYTIVAEGARRSSEKFKVREVFGSRRNAGWLFGDHMPALLVYEDRPYPVVYPHIKYGRIVGIEEALERQKEAVLR